MEITSFHFLFFVSIVLVVYHLLSHRAQNYWLLIASYTFYIFWSWKFALLLLTATVFNFEIAKHLRKGGKRHTLLLWLGLGANFALFMVFKASSFYYPRLLTLLDQMGISTGLIGLQIIIPLGLSYYVLQNISYLVDVYRGQIPASTNRVDFALYLAYFPKMVAGPIERARNFLPTLAKPRQVNNQGLVRSIVLILVGLTRKLLIANPLFAHLPWDEFIGTPSVFSSMEQAGWLIVYSFGLYNDFAGYTSIVRGVSGLFGIELSKNFNTPYFSKNITEFWNRWHITLSHWLRDYIFFPLNRALAQKSSNRNSWYILVIPPIITMLISGFWHGPNLQMLLWGTLQGLYLVIERFINLRQLPSNRNTGGLIFWFITFLIVILAWPPFTMRIPFALNFWQQLFIGNLFGLRDYTLLFSLAILLPAILLDWAQYNKADESFFLEQKPLTQAFLIATVIMVIFLTTMSNTGQPFVYQGF